MTIAHDESVLIVDFGSQVTQLIARRVREAGVYSEIAPFSSAEAAFHRMKPKGIILSGGPASVTEEGSPRAPDAVFNSGLPILGICYGEQTLAQQLGGKVEGGHHRRIRPRLPRDHRRLRAVRRRLGKGEAHQVWMSHGDRVTALRPASAPSLPRPARPSPHRRRRAQASTPCSSTPKSCTRRMAASCSQFRAPSRGCRGDWTMGLVKAEADRQDPRAGRQGPRDLRAVGRRRQCGRRGADP
jgi:GMP synthase (glutamine-hydrolysing)